MTHGEEPSHYIEIPLSAAQPGPARGAACGSCHTLPATPASTLTPAPQYLRSEREPRNYYSDIDEGVLCSLLSIMKRKCWKGWEVS